MLPIAGLAMLLALPAQGSEVFTSFFRDLESAHFPAAAADQGMRSLRATRFEPESRMGAAAAAFLITLDTVLLNEATRDPSTGNLKGLANLGPVDAGVIVHELWHSYYWNVFRRSGSPAATFYEGEYQTRYAGYPPKDRETIQEEGYGLFIQEVTRDYLQIRSLLDHATPEQRQALRANPRFIQAYERSFTDSVYGYYGGFGSQPVYSTVPISQADKDQILSFFFQNKITGHFAADFPE
jgi:hypothetical protein